MLVILISRCQRDFAPHAFGPQSKHLGDHLFLIVNALCWKSTFPEVGVIWLLAHAFRSRSKRLGADLFSDIVNALCWLAILRFRPDLAPGSRLPGPE